MPSTQEHGLAHLEAWLGDASWDVIHFNHGLHDLKYVDAQGKNTRSKEDGHIQIPLESYGENLEKIAKRLKQTGAHLIFATTTPSRIGLQAPCERPKKPNDTTKSPATSCNATASPSMTSMPWPCPSSRTGNSPIMCTSPRKALWSWPKKWPGTYARRCPSSPDTMPVQLGIWAPGNLPAAGLQACSQEGLV